MFFSSSKNDLVSFWKRLRKPTLTDRVRNQKKFSNHPRTPLDFLPGAYGTLFFDMKFTFFAWYLDVFSLSVKMTLCHSERDWGNQISKWSPILEKNLNGHSNTPKYLTLEDFRYNFLKFFHKKSLGRTGICFFQIPAVTFFKKTDASANLLHFLVFFAKNVYWSFSAFIDIFRIEDL